MLFGDALRTDSTPKREAESLFAFYDRSARQRFQVTRRLLDGWLGAMPAPAGSALAARMRSGNDEEFEAALAELIMHAMLVRLGFHVALPPSGPACARRPDFLLCRVDGTPVAWLEVTTLNGPRAATTADQREAAILDWLNGIALPDGTWLSYWAKRRGDKSPSLRRLSERVERWARTNASSAHDGEDVVATFGIDGWEIGLRLLPGSAPRSGRPAIGIRHLEPLVSKDAEVADALAGRLRAKARRYGSLDLPYCITVVDRTEQLAFISGDDLAVNVADALFGVPRYGVPGQPRRDGFWTARGRPANSQVSAVLAFSRGGLGYLADPGWQPLLVRNPEATHPLPDGVLPVQELVIKNGCGTVQARRVIGEILELPTPWPPE